MRSLNLNDAYSLFHRGALALARAERQGIRIDLEEVEKQKRKLNRKIEKYTDEFQATDFYKDWKRSRGSQNLNINSGTQLAEYLYKVKNIKPQKYTAKGYGATDVEALEGINIPGVDTLVKIRKFEKILNTYLDGFLKEQVNGWIHPVFNLNLVKTYRSSSNNPNFQNIPIRDEEAKRATRSVLYPRKGHILLEIDYSGIEVGISCCYHKDKRMIQYVKDKSSNMHTDMAEQIYMLKKEDINDKAFKVLRGSAKNSFVFPQFYGDYYKNNAIGILKWTGLNDGPFHKGTGLELRDGIHLADHFRDNGIKSIKSLMSYLREVEDHFWNERFCGYRDWREKVWKEYQKKAYYQTLTGFVLKGPMTRNEFLNAPIQGSAFHCLLWSFVELDRLMVKEKWDTKLIGQIHDSIIFDVHPDELDYVLETVQRVTCRDLPERWSWIIVPLEIEAEMSGVDKSWYHKKEIKLTA